MLKKKLMIEFILALIIIFTFFSYQGHISKNNAPVKNQIGSDVYYQNIDSNIDVKYEIVPSSYENYFEINMVVDGVEYNPTANFHVVLDPYYSNKEEVISLMNALQQRYGFYSFELHTLDNRDFLVNVGNHFNDISIVHALIPMENTTTVQEIIETIPKEEIVFVYAQELYETSETIFDCTNIELEDFLYQFGNIFGQIIVNLNENIAFCTYASETNNVYYDANKHQLIISEVLNQVVNKYSISIRLKNECVDTMTGVAEISFHKEGVIQEFEELKVYPYTTQISFKNTCSLTGKALGDSIFELKHNDTCSYCLGEPIASKIASSDSDGKVVFDHVASGHAYLLSQLSVNDHYELNKTSSLVSVVYGDVYFKDGEILKNSPKKTESIAANLACIIDNQLIDYPYDLHFKISSGEQVPLPLNQEMICNDSKELFFDPITFDKTGIYQYRISCLNRGFQVNDIIVVVNVTLNGQQLEAKITYYNQSIKDNNTITLKD